MSDNVSGRKTLDDGARKKSSIERGTSSSDMSVDEGSAKDSLKCKGNTKPSVNKRSEEFSEYKCDPCSSAGDHSEAEGYCTECEEYLCNICFKSHSRSKATRNHSLLNKDDMPRKSCKTCDPCETTGEETDAVGYCWECEEYLCSSCFRSHSRTKATKSHYLIDKNKMPVESDSDIASSIAKVDIQEGDTGYQKYNEKYSYERNIKVKDSWREKQCYIVAMSLVSNTELVLADYGNKSLKLVDIERHILKGTKDLESYPYGLTTISKDQIAVLLANIGVIQFVAIAGNLSVQRTVKVIGVCLDIEFVNGKIYASFCNPVNFQVLLQSGAVKKTISPDSRVTKYCKHPRCIAVSPDETLIYTSDSNTNKVMGIDMNGTLICVYHSELDQPHGVAISVCGSVFLCDRSQDAVYKMPPDLSKATAILGPADNLRSPHALCLSAEKQHLYISNGCGKAKVSNYIQVFKWLALN